MKGFRTPGCEPRRFRFAVATLAPFVDGHVSLLHRRETLMNSHDSERPLAKFLSRGPAGNVGNGSTGAAATHQPHRTVCGERPVIFFAERDVGLLTGRPIRAKMLPSLHEASARWRSSTTKLAYRRQPHVRPTSPSAEYGTRRRGLLRSCWQASSTASRMGSRRTMRPVNCCSSTIDRKSTRL